MKQGKVIHLFRKPGRWLSMEAVEEIQAIAGKGLVNDASYGKEKRQVLLVGRQVLEEFGLQAGDVRENITVDDLELEALPIGTRLAVGSCILETTSICEPCNRIEELRPGLRQAISGKRGVLARVVQSGLIRVGDAVSCLTRDGDLHVTS
jgi:MOSC domain-containing protein YiiM